MINVRKFINSRLLEGKMIDTKKGSLDDIASLSNPLSLVRSAFKGKIKLAECPLLEFTPDQSYHSTEIRITQDEDSLDYYPAITEICKSARAIGRQEKFHAGVIEAFRNAYQHGNKKNPQKKVTLYHRLQPHSFEVVVADEGGDINADFIPFILMHRYNSLASPESFYHFARGATRAEENSGIGTFVIHKVSDEVNYFKNGANGLSVQMIIRKK